MSAIRIRRATPRNALEIAELHAESWRQTYAGMLPAAFLADGVSQNRMALWRARFATPARSRDFVIVALDEGRIAGFACLMAGAHDGHGPLLDNLHVRSEFKGRGIGTQLFAAAAREASRISDRMHLWVLSDNEPARRFYESHGGTAQDTRRDELVPGVFVQEIRYAWDAGALARVTRA